MCGFAGYCSLVGSAYHDDQQLLAQLGRILRHRGPDGAGQWVSLKQGIALVHRRLKIVDITDAAAQPMLDDEQSIVLCFNGELYNHLHIRAELIALGYHFSSTSDTQTLLYAYKAWGIDCIKRFEGMFAFVLFDICSNELYLVRDRIGIKPLYFSLQGQMVSFASEIKALFTLPWISKSIRPDAVGHYLTFLVTPAPMTLYDGIYKLPAGFYAKIDAQRTLTFHEWYNPLSSQANESNYDEKTYINNFEALLQDSVKKHLMADVPLGIFLSGGIDSSLIASLMQSHTTTLKTFNVSFTDGPELQEREWARRVAEHVGAEHHELIISEREAFTFFEDMVYHQDEPLGDCVCIPLYYVARLAKDTGITVVQVGEGADELLCGYNTYLHYLKLAPWWQQSQRIIPEIAKRIVAGTASHIYKKRTMMQDLITMWAANRPLFWGGVRVFSEHCKKRIIEQQFGQSDDLVYQMYPGMHSNNSSYDIIDYHRQQLFAHYPHADFLMQMTYLELKHRLPELLLMRVDKMTMATSIEARVPFLDHRLVELALHMPQQIKIKGGMSKYVLKKIAERYLPHDIIYRKKVGFAAPAQRWFKQGKYFRFYFADILNSKTQWHALLNIPHIQQMLVLHEQGAHDYTYQLWALQNLMSLE